MFRPLFAAALAATLAAPALADSPKAAPLVEKYLLEGKLADGEKALTARLAEHPKDDQARFGLAIVQFFRGIERLGGGLHRYGFKTTSNFPTIPGLARLVPENPRPEKLTYPRLRALAQAWVDDLGRVGATLDAITDDAVKLPLPIGRIHLDLFGQGKPVSAAALLLAFEMRGAAALVKDTVVGFDRGDVHWLRGYCHFLAAWGELYLALDAQERFNCTAHHFFGNVDTPHAFLREEKLRLADIGPSLDRFPVIADFISLIHLSLRLPIKEPARMKRVLENLEGMVKNGKLMWKHILAETDDDNEWIPNPRQKSVLPATVTEEMVVEWRKTLDEVERVLSGEKLLPFWRGSLEKRGTRGVDLRRVFLAPPKHLDIIQWVQGTAATPYLKDGRITDLADAATIRRLDRTFGGVAFFGFAMWFN